MRKLQHSPMKPATMATTTKTIRNRSIMENSGPDDPSLATSNHATANFKVGPIGVETGQYPQAAKEHIANREQIVYIAFLQAIPAARQGPRCRGGEFPA